MSVLVISILYFLKKDSVSCPKTGRLAAEKRIARGGFRKNEKERREGAALWSTDFLFQRAKNVRVKKFCQRDLQSVAQLFDRHNAGVSASAAENVFE